MTYAGATAIVTGAGQGIGRALAVELAQRGARVFVNDLSEERAQNVADEVQGLAHCGDLRDPQVVRDMVASAQSEFGSLDMLFSNAGFALGEPDGPTSQDDSHWQASWDLHVMTHLRASRLLLPMMLKRGSGTLVNIASAAGLLSQIGDAAYSATKHAAVSLAQSLAIEHAKDSIQVSVVCPLYVATPLLGYSDEDTELPNGVISPDAVAKATLDGVARGDFLICPHPEAAKYFAQRGANTNRWIKGMQRLNERLKSETDRFDPETLHRLI